jgi:hypothetical protein
MFAAKDFFDSIDPERTWTARFSSDEKPNPQQVM